MVLTHPSVMARLGVHSLNHYTSPLYWYGHIANGLAPAPQQSTCEEDDVPVLGVMGLQPDQTVEVRGVAGQAVALMVWQELHQVSLLVGGEQV